jgi:hypothetical protein
MLARVRASQWKSFLAETECGRWTSPATALSIEYGLDVMEEIRAAACESLRQFSNGGLDVGGILFGTHLDDSIRILKWWPIPCEHADGPDLSLSEDDRRELVRMLLAAKQDPGLQSLQAVGWFLSHMRGEISLSPRDLEIFNGYFAEPWQVTLVLLPAADCTVNAGFFVRETGGKLRSESSYKEFIIAPPRAASPPKANYWRWLWAIPTLLAMVLAGLLIKPPHPEEGAANPGISLRIQGDGAALRINWDANSASVRGATRAEIEIEDGGKADDDVSGSWGAGSGVCPACDHSHSSAAKSRARYACRGIEQAKRGAASGEGAIGETTEDGKDSGESFGD